MGSINTKPMEKTTRVNLDEKIARKILIRIPSARIEPINSPSSFVNYKIHVLDERYCPLVQEIAGVVMQWVDNDGN